MRRGIKTLILAATVAVLWSPAPASADGFVSPWVGSNFARELDGSVGSFGVTAGSMGAGIIGGEFDFGYSPSYWDKDVFGNNNVLDLMGNLIVGIPIGGQKGPGIRPYVTGGLGIIRQDFDGLLDSDAASNTDFAYNLGGGIMGYLGTHFGLRGDIRYMRTINSDVTDSDFDPELGLGSFHFWRASFGVVFR
jgi:hypothetical protein